MAIDPSFKCHSTLVLDCLGFIGFWPLVIQVCYILNVLEIFLLDFGPFKFVSNMLFIHGTLKFSRFGSYAWFIGFIHYSLVHSILVLSIHYHLIKSTIMFRQYHSISVQSIETQYKYNFHSQFAYFITRMPLSMQKSQIWPKFSIVDFRSTVDFRSIGDFR